MELAQLFKKRPDKTSLLAVCPHHDGVAVARVRHRGDNSKELMWLEFMPTFGELPEANKGFQTIARRQEAQRAVCTSTLGIGEYNLVLIDAPDVPPSEVPAAVRWQVNELIDLHIDEAVIDVFDVPPNAGQSPKRVYAVAARSEQVREVAEDFEAAGLTLEFIDIPEFAIRNLTSLMPEDDTGIVFIHLERAHGLITVTRQGSVFLSRRIEFGYANLIEHQVDVFDERMQGLLDALVIEIQRTLDYYERHFSQPTVSAVVIAPLPAAVPGLTDYLHSQLGITTQFMDLNTLVHSHEPVPMELQAQCALAVGAALRREERAL